jgi:hypothetical protein
VNLVPTGVSGFAEPEQPAELANYANIPVCPNIASRRDAHAEPYDLEVRVTDVDRRVVELRARVVPVCAEEASRAQCECECDSHFLTSLECPAILAAEDAPRDFDCPVLDGEGEEAEGEDAEGEEAE